jgi:hypothetical protein
MDNLYCATQNNSRGTKYIGDTLQNSSIPFASSSSPQNKDGTWNEFKESDAGPTAEGNVIPFVNLNTYDDSFSSPQRLTPMSRKALQRAGFETGAIYCFPCTHQSVTTLIHFILQKCLYVLRGEDWWRFVWNAALAPANAALAPEVYKEEQKSFPKLFLLFQYHFQFRILGFMKWYGISNVISMVWYFEFSFSELGNFFLKKTMLPY